MKEELAFQKALGKYLNAFWVGEEEEKEVLEVVRSKRLGADTGGNKVKTFESLVAQYQGVRYATAVTSGTAALHLSLVSLGVGRGDEVILPAISSMATTNVILYQNAVPVFADLDPRTINMNPDSLAERITKRTKVVIPVHMYGCPCDMKPIMEIARDHGLFVIEDSCLAQGAEYHGKKVGNIGDIGCFSFGSGKQLYTGQGGVTITDNDEIGRELAKRNHHYGVKRNGWLIGTSDILGYNYKMSELVGAVGIAQIKKLDMLNAKRIENAEYLTQNLKDVKGIKTPYVPPDTKHVFNEYLLTVDEEAVGMTRDDFCRAVFLEGGIFADLLFSVPMYLEPSLSWLDCKRCHVAEEILRKVMIVSPHPGLDKNDLDEIIGVLKKLTEQS